MNTRVRKHPKLRGQAMAEVLLIGPLVVFILITAAYVGTYFYTYSVSQAVSYSNSVHYSFSGDPKLLSNPNFSSAEESVTYWNQAIHQNQIVYDDCFQSHQKFMSTLSIIDTGEEKLSLFSYVPFGNIITRSLSIAFRPEFGGVDPNRYGLLCKMPQTKGIFTVPGIFNGAPFTPSAGGPGSAGPGK
jgi:hypothetical protein